MARKYEPLGLYLLDLRKTQNEVTLSYEQVERIINGKLPPSAHTHHPWWGNEQVGRHVPSYVWMEAGWKVDTVNLSEKWVRFVVNAT